MEPFQIRYAFVSSVQSVQRPHLVGEDLGTRFLPEGALKYRSQACVGNRDRFGGFVRIQRESIVIIRHAVIVVVLVRIVANAVGVRIDRLVRVQRKGVVGIRHAVVIVVRVHVVGNAVAVCIDRGRWLSPTVAGNKRKDQHHAREP